MQDIFVENKRHWSTADEINFIAHLGSHGSPALLRQRKPLLQRYLTAMHLRARWGNVDENAVRRAVLTALMERA